MKMNEWSKSLFHNLSITEGREFESHQSTDKLWFWLLKWLQLSPDNQKQITRTKKYNMKLLNLKVFNKFNNFL